MPRTLPPPVLTSFHAPFRIANAKILSLASIRTKPMLNSNNRRPRLVPAILA